jgi:arylsulfatase A-like enzyme
MLSRRRFLATAAAPLARSAQVKPLNFVFILIDDMGWRDCAPYGSEYYETPNIQRLAAEGVRFTNAYAACPVCSPTRGAILTGKYPARLQLTDWIPGRRQHATARLLVPEFNQQLPLTERTIAEALKPSGYRTASIGKWHLGGDGFDPTMQGFDLNIAGTFRGSPPGYFGPFDLPNLNGGTKQDELSGLLAGKAEEYLEQNRDRPFFLYLPHFAVHTPLQARQELIAKYEKKPRPQGHPVYGAMVETMDAAVGRVLRKLDELGIADRTVVFFTSDNGGLRYEGRREIPVTDNSPARAGKGHLYEGGIRVPLIIRWPGVAKTGSTCGAPVTSTDFFSTILEMAGPVGRTPDGTSLVPLLKGGNRLGRSALFWHYPHYSNQGGAPGGAVRRGDWKLIEFYEDKRIELYNLSNDPGEKTNLARREAKRAAELRAALHEWRGSVRAAMPQDNPQYDPATADQGLRGAELRTDPV